MAFKEEEAHIICVCGEVFQHIPRGGEEWDEDRTAEKFHAHAETCTAVAEAEGEARQQVRPASKEEIAQRDRVMKAAGVK